MSDYSASLLLVDDDEVLRTVLTSSLQRRGLSVYSTDNIEQALQLAEQQEPEYAIIDLNLNGKNGLQLVAQLHQLNPMIRMVVLTGYASIATAVEAIKLGATHYLAKPADTDQILQALMRDDGGDAEIPLAEQPMSVRRMEWEHIQKVLNEVGGNISEAARRLNMHRRTLQRKLNKKPVNQ